MEDPRRLSINDLRKQSISSQPNLTSNNNLYNKTNFSQKRRFTAAGDIGLTSSNVNDLKKIYEKSKASRYFYLLMSGNKKLNYNQLNLGKSFDKID
jgi:hypothetical protein